MPVEQFTLTNQPDGFETSAVGRLVRGSSPGLNPSLGDRLVEICVRHGNSILNTRSVCSYDLMGDDLFALTRVRFAGADQASPFFAHTLVFAPEALAGHDHNPLALARTFRFPSREVFAAGTLPGLEGLGDGPPGAPDARPLLKAKAIDRRLGGLLAALLGAAAGGRPLHLSLPGGCPVDKILEVLFGLLPPALRCRTTFCTRESDPEGQPAQRQVVVRVVTATAFDFTGRKFTSPLQTVYAATVAGWVRRDREDIVRKLHGLGEKLGAGRDLGAWNVIAPAAALFADRPRRALVRAAFRNLRRAAAEWAGAPATFLALAEVIRSRDVVDQSALAAAAGADLAYLADRAAPVPGWVVPLGESSPLVSYRLAAGGRYGPDLLWLLRVKCPPAEFAGLVLVANEQGVPRDAEDGVVLARWRTRTGPQSGEQRVGVSLAPVRDRGWARFYCKALPLDPAPESTPLVVHPDCCVPRAADGRSVVPNARPRPRSWPADSVVCPRCFRRFKAAEILVPDYVPARDRPSGWLVAARLLEIVDDDHGAPARKICPRCRGELPVTAGDEETLVVGLVGEAQSGKSHYLASLVQRLQARGLCGDRHSPMLPLTDDTAQRYSLEYFQAAFGAREQLPVHEVTPLPLIYGLRLRGGFFGDGPDRSVTLSLHDTAGVNFSTREPLARTVRFLPAAAGLLFLVDPLHIEAVREAMRQRVDLPPCQDPADVFGRVLRELEGAGFLAGGKLTTPAAVVLTKADLLHESGLIPANRLWGTDWKHVRGFNPRGHQDMHGMVGELVRRWSPALYALVRGRFERHAFFAASATGCAPAEGRFEFVAPWRVEDPMVWLLAELGVVPTR